MANDKDNSPNLTFTGAITVNGPMFDIHDNEHVHIGVPLEEAINSECSGRGLSRKPSGKEDENELNREKLANAIEECQMFFWANSSYAVVFCLCRDVYGIEDNKIAFERMIESLP